MVNRSVRVTIMEMTEDMIAELEKKWRQESKDPSGEGEGEPAEYYEDDPNELDFG